MSLHKLEQLSPRAIVPDEIRILRVRIQQFEHLPEIKDQSENQYQRSLTASLSIVRMHLHTYGVSSACEYKFKCEYEFETKK